MRELRFAAVADNGRGRLRKYCSKRCGVLARKERAPACKEVGCTNRAHASGLCIGHYQRIWRCGRQISAYVPKDPMLFHGACVECGSPWEGQSRSNRRFCSRLCQKRNSDRIKTRARRAATRGAHVERFDPIEVFERDGWRCHLCGLKTHRAKHGTNHPMAPVLDHVDPVSKLGPHTKRNTRCAHHKCNTAKGARPLGQLVLM